MKLNVHTDLGTQTLVSMPKLSGRIARLCWDVYNPEYNYQWRKAGKITNAPQTLVFNQSQKGSKGDRIKVSLPMQKYIQGIQTDKRGWNALLDPKTGWLNKVTDPMTCEAVSFAGNLVLVAEQSGKFSKIAGMTSVGTHTYFTPNGCLYVHKLSAGNFTKIGAGVDAFIPNLLNGMWTLTTRLEFLPDLPLKVRGHIVSNYVVVAGNIYGIIEDGTQVLLTIADLGMKNPACK